VPVQHTVFFRSSADDLTIFSVSPLHPIFFLGFSDAVAIRFCLSAESSFISLRRAGPVVRRDLRRAFCCKPLSPSFLFLDKDFWPDRGVSSPRQRTRPQDLTLHPAVQLVFFSHPPMSADEFALRSALNGETSSKPSLEELRLLFPYQRSFADALVGWTAAMRPSEMLCPGLWIVFRPYFPIRPTSVFAALNSSVCCVNFFFLSEHRRLSFAHRVSLLLRQSQRSFHLRILRGLPEYSTLRCLFSDVSHLF